MTDAKRLALHLVKTIDEPCFPAHACNSKEPCLTHSIYTVDGNIVYIADNRDQLYSFNLVERFVSKEELAALLVSRTKQHGVVNQVKDKRGITAYIFKTGYVLNVQH